VSLGVCESTSLDELSLKIYDTTGRLVRRVVSERPYGAGEHTVRWDGASAGGQPVASGVYFIVLETDQVRRSRPIVRVE